MYLEDLDLRVRTYVGLLVATGSTSVLQRTYLVKKNACLKKKRVLACCLACLLADVTRHFGDEEYQRHSPGAVACCRPETHSILFALSPFS